MGAAEVSSYRDVPRQSFDLVDSRALDRPFSSRFQDHHSQTGSPW
jgi:hypothetical protein